VQIASPIERLVGFSSSCRMTLSHALFKGFRNWAVENVGAPTFLIFPVKKQF
jgi:hypothetical protein